MTLEILPEKCTGTELEEKRNEGINHWITEITIQNLAI